MYQTAGAFVVVGGLLMVVVVVARRAMSSVYEAVAILYLLYE